ncbi:Hsp70 family protein [Kiloniella sp. b19]|uniref:Hsp70 family protein n=1 Tax=Kiloniella sp. GXU_MW_B19 TaxID=3141326 RepID=UPI0031E48B96
MRPERKGSAMISCGLDFGTSNSAIGLALDGRITLCPLEEGRITMPTALFYYNNEPKITMGRQAIQDYLNGEEGRLLRSIKSLLGTGLISEQTVLNGQRRAFTSVIQDYIERVKIRAEKHSGQKLERVVEGRPVHFVDNSTTHNDAAENSLRSILEETGFKDIRFQYEPLAAARCFAATNRDKTDQGIALIVDVGGGTTDFTLLDFASGGASETLRKEAILANHGIRLGGTNFDKALSLAKVMPLLGYKTLLKGDKNLLLPDWVFKMLATWSEIVFLYGREKRSDVNWIIQNGAAREEMQRLKTVIEWELGHSLCNTVEEAKIALSSQDQWSMNLKAIEHGLETSLDLQEVSEILQSDLDRFNRAITETLQLGNIRADQVSHAVMTGGSTNLTALKDATRAMLPRARMVEMDKLSAVCQGLALEALEA